MKSNFKDICHSFHLKMWQWTGEKTLFLLWRSDEKDEMTRRGHLTVTFKQVAVKKIKDCNKSWENSYVSTNVNTNFNFNQCNVQHIC